MNFAALFSHCLILLRVVLLGRSLVLDDFAARKSKGSPIGANSSQPLSVKLGMYLESLGNFRETEMSFDVDLYLYMSWRDESLTHSATDFLLINEDNVRKQLWLPDLYFANAREAHFHTVTVPNFNLFVARDGTVAYSCRVTLTVACNLDLVNYPMDYQKCFIRVLSYAYIASEMNVTWFRETPIRYNSEIELPEFEIERVSDAYCNGTYRYAVMAHSYKVARFSCLEANIHLQRSIGYNLVQSFIPTGLIVMISWVSFWIDRRAVPARVTLSFTTLVSLTTIGNGLQFGLPQVSYAKAIDFWFGACMLFVFCALLEFAVVNSYMRRSEKYERLSRRIAAKNIEETEKLFPKLSYYTMSKLGERVEKAVRRNTTVGGNGEWRQFVNPAALLRESPSHSARTQEQPLEDDDPGGRNSNEYAFELNDFRVHSSLSNRQCSEVDPPVPSRSRSWSSQLRSFTQSPAHTKRASSLAEQYAHMAIVFSRRALRIDQCCRYIFPLVFLMWNLFYWWYYGIVHKPPK